MLRGHRSSAVKVTVAAGNEGRALPRIDRAALPDLDVLTGVFGSLADVIGAEAEGDNEAGLLPVLHPFVFPE